MNEIPGNHPKRLDAIRQAEARRQLDVMRPYIAQCVESVMQAWTEYMAEQAEVMRKMLSDLNGIDLLALREKRLRENN